LAHRSWHRKEARFQGERGVQIYYQTWTPLEKPKAISVLAHGQGDHGGRYAHVAERMARIGLAVWALDHRGHGKSEGKRGHVDDFDDYLADIGSLIRIAKKDTSAVKTFLIGHSLGGLIVIDYAEKHGDELAGLVASGPLLRLRMRVSPAKAFIGKMLSSIAPAFSMDTGLDPNLLSHDQKIVRDYASDPLVHSRASARFYTELLRAEHETIRTADKLLLPCLLMQGGADGIVDPSATVDLFKKVASSDKTLKVYDGFYHEILNEPGKESVLSDIEAWLSARI